MSINAFKKIDNGAKFFLAVAFSYAGLAVWDPALFSQAWEFFQSMLFRILPLLFLVFGFMVLINLFFTKKRTEKYLGRDSGARSWLFAIVSGILISGPPYVLYPLLGELKRKGMSNSLLAVFLYNRNVKIPFFPALVFYFGLKYSLFLSFYIIIFSIINGLLVGYFTRGEKA